eukprot:jgi/Tetstr1/462572/TSEL_007558.t1
MYSSGDASHQENITRLLWQRETTGRVAGRVRERTPCLAASGGRCTCGKAGSSAADLPRWVESDFLRRCSATYCPLRPAPRSTIAAAFSADGTLLASTHGDHTVKLVCCRTGKCLQTLHGHRRTPWVVRFHPHNSTLLASGSLDHEVRLWSAGTGECLNIWDFGRPISSLAFHSQGNVLAVASGHRLHMWEYDKGVSGSSAPSVCLRTRRSLRAVHFHPHGAPLLLTAEVNDPELQDFPQTQALSRAGSASGVFEQARTGDGAQGRRAGGAPTPGSLRRSGSFGPSGPVWVPGADRRGHHPGSLLAADAGSNRGWQAPALRALAAAEGSDTGDSGPAGPPPTTATTAAASAASQPGSSSASDGSPARHRPPELGLSRLGPHSPEASDASMGVSDAQPRTGSRTQTEPEADAMEVDSAAQPPPGQQRHRPRNMRRQIDDASGDGAALPPTLVPMGWELPADILQRNILQHQQASSGQGADIGGSGASEASAVAGGAAAAPGGFPPANAEAMAAATAAAAAIANHERPCTVKLRLWRFDAKSPRKVLDAPRLTIPHAVLCSEMGVHFSPCGRYVAACVACQAPPGDEADPHSGTPINTSIYELRVFSLEKASFGRVMQARQIRAAHCLTSIQFSPSSEHLLLAYGRRHISLLRSLAADRGSIIPVHTILEVYRVSDMSLVRVLPSADDEVNVAAFHPLAGGGIVYGTKEGRLRILRHDRTPPPPFPDGLGGRSLEYELREADEMASAASDSDDSL